MEMNRDMFFFGGGGFANMKRWSYKPCVFRGAGWFRREIWLLRCFVGYFCTLREEAPFYHRHGGVSCVVRLAEIAPLFSQMSPALKKKNAGYDALVTVESDACYYPLHLQKKQISRWSVKFIEECGTQSGPIHAGFAHFLKGEFGKDLEFHEFTWLDGWETTPEILSSEKLWFAKKSAWNWSPFSLWFISARPLLNNLLLVAVTCRQLKTIIHSQPPQKEICPTKTFLWCPNLSNSLPYNACLCLAFASLFLHPPFLFELAPAMTCRVANGQTLLQKQIASSRGHNF